MLYCDFGDFNTQELISSPIEFTSEQRREKSSDFLGAYATSTTTSDTTTIRPIPITSSTNDHVLYQNMAFSAVGNVPQLPPKSHIPPPYRPPPNTTFYPQVGPTQVRNFVVEHDDPFQVHKGHSSNLAMSSSDGGSHDSHNDSGYCAVRGSGGPSPSLSGNYISTLNPGI